MTATATGEVAEFIERRLREIEEQLKPFEELERERRRLRQALGALRDELPRVTAPRGASQANKRAARGSNLTAILAHVAATPGSTAGEIADATGISRGVVYSATSRLAAAGRLRREPKPDGSVAYHPAD
jgi:sugar-specific transcriptional regulator TrmB